MNNTDQDIKDENFFAEEDFYEDEDLFEEIVIVEKFVLPTEIPEGFILGRLKHNK